MDSRSDPSLAAPVTYGAEPRAKFGGAVLCVGVQASHGSSLAELLAQHGLVKVQLNAACEGPAAAGAQLAAAAGALAALTWDGCFQTLNMRDCAPSFRQLPLA